MKNFHGLFKGQFFLKKAYMVKKKFADTTRVNMVSKKITKDLSLIKVYVLYSIFFTNNKGI